MAVERIIVCVGPGPHGARLVRAGRAMAAGRAAEWVVVYVETPGHARLPQEDRDWVDEHLRLAEALGARAVRLSGDSVSSVLLDYARAQGATKILVGKPTHPRWRDRFRGSLLDDIIRRSGAIEVYASSGEEAEEPRRPPIRPTHGSPLRSYLSSLVVVALAAVVAALMVDRFQTSDLSLVFLLATVIVALRFGRGPSIVAATVGVAVFDFCFVPPFFSFRVHQTPYVLTFLVMLVVGVTIGTLATRVRDQAESARSYAQWAATLHALSRELAEARNADGIVASASRHIQAVLGGRTAFVLPSPSGGLAWPEDMDPADEQAARRTFEHGVPSGAGTGDGADAPSLCLPLSTGSRTIGVLAFRPDAPASMSDVARRRMLEALGHQVAGALERALLAEEAKSTELRARAEELRSSLLSSVSHDLRTPLAAIMGSATTLLQGSDLRSQQRADLARTVYEEAERLSRLVTNLLAMTRVESGALALRKEWVPFEEVVGAALERLGDRLGRRAVKSVLPDDLPLVPVDPVLIEQVLLNLLDNVVRHTRPGASVAIEVAHDAQQVTVEVRDGGPGLPPGLEDRLFEKFTRGPGAPSGGSGLGLAICRGIVLAHGGAIDARNAPEGGAIFRFTLPLGGPAPIVPAEEATPASGMEDR
jgi:two-component system sensor histidine kinase KdpD